MEMEFAKKFRELRKEHSYTQAAIAKILNVHQTTIRDWETRGKQPSFETLCKIAEIFEVTVGQLLGVEKY